MSVSFVIGVSFLLEVLAGLITRHDTPPSQTPSPSFPHNSTSPRTGCKRDRGKLDHHDEDEVRLGRRNNPWECRGAVMGAGDSVRLRDIALVMNGMRRMAGSARLRARTGRPARGSRSGGSANARCGEQMANRAR